VRRSSCLAARIECCWGLGPCPARHVRAVQVCIGSRPQRFNTKDTGPSEDTAGRVRFAWNMLVSRSFSIPVKTE